MDNQDKHINQKPEGNYPEPGVPVGDAWADMKDILDQEMPLPDTLTTEKYIIVNSLKFLIPAVIILIVCIMSWNYYFDKKHIIGNHIKPVDSYSFSKRKEISDKTKMKEENNDQKDNSFIQKIKIDSGTANSVNASSNTKTTNAPKTIDSSSVQPATFLEIGNKPVSQPKSRIANENKRSASIGINNRSVSVKPAKIKRSKYNSGKNYSIEISASNPTENDKNIAERNIANQQNNFAGKFNNKSKFNEKAFSISLKDDLLKKANETKMALLIIARSNSYSNKLKEDFGAIDIKNVPVKISVNERKSKILNLLSKNIQAGIQWNLNLPIKGYDQFFTGANNKSNQFFTVFIPGIWVEKKLNNGNGIMLKLNPYSQYFGNNEDITSSTTSLSDSLGITKITNSTRLVKISGMSGGLQYNQQIYNKLSIGIGANIYWQNRALLNKTASDSAKIIMSDSLYSVKETSNEGKYLNLYFVTTNMEVLYKWRMFQFGGGISVPVTSMTGISDRKIRPVSGQLVFRWRLK
ncbi:hypothetical protein [Dyadobacter sp. NIV53]|uniref:hypothetical protein n=1 Tax=Dyadobacter sp. NIV53 TaxID=2861765 RepID=UPI001C882960|nr:hypothetical protein [Dyadobacter sp. NIV53]